MDFLTEFWGNNDKIGIPEICARTVTMFFFLLLLIRISGMRPFGKGESFDTLVSILLGAVAARGIVGATPFFSTVASTIVLVVVHRILSALAFYNKWIGKRLKGNPCILYKNGQFMEDNMKGASITQHDIYEELRLSLQKDSLEEIKEIYIERTGKISFVKK